MGYTFHKFKETRAQLPGLRKRGRLTGGHVQQNFCLKRQIRQTGHVFFKVLISLYKYIIFIYVMFTYKSILTKKKSNPDYMSNNYSNNISNNYSNNITDNLADN